MLSNFLLLVGVPLLMPIVAFSGMIPRLAPANPSTPTATAIRQEEPALGGFAGTDDFVVAYPERFDANTTDTEGMDQEAWIRGSLEGLGREMDQPSDMAGVFANQEVIERLLVEEAFIYLPGGNPNPMLIPWRRQDVVASELQEAADELVLQGEHERAIEIYRRIMSEMPGSRYATDAQRRIQLAEAEIRARDMPVGTAVDLTVEERQRELPSAVALGVSGILWSDEPGVFLGDALLRVGDVAPGFEEVTVLRITKSEVVFLFDNREHAISLEFGDVRMTDPGLRTQ